MSLSRTHDFAQYSGGFKYSPLLQEKLVYIGQLEVYNQASEVVDKLMDLSVSSSTVYRMCNYYGDLIEDQLYDLTSREVDQQTGERAEQASDVLYAQFDGGFIFSDRDWQEVKLGRVFKQSDCQVSDNEDRGARILHSEYAAYLGHYSGFTPRLSVLIEEQKQAKLPLVFLTDGAVWMRNWMNETYPEAIQILDFYHLCEHLAKFAKCAVGSVQKNYQRWYDRQKKAIREGKAKQVIKRIKALKLVGKYLEEKKKLLSYLQDNLYRMNYDQYRKAGYMIGSGAIEAAHRTVVQKRMKLSGQRWADKGAQNMLNLRVAYMSNRQELIKRNICLAA